MSSLCHLDVIPTSPLCRLSLLSTAGKDVQRRALRREMTQRGHTLAIVSHPPPTDPPTDPSSRVTTHPSPSTLIRSCASPTRYDVEATMLEDMAFAVDELQHVELCFKVWHRVSYGVIGCHRAS